MVQKAMGRWHASVARHVVGTRSCLGCKQEGGVFIRQCHMAEQKKWRAGIQTRQGHKAGG